MSNITLSGNLTFLSLADVFQLLGGNNSIGKLQIRSQYADTPGVVYFVNGNPVNANSGSLRGLEAIYPMFGWTEGNFEFHQEKVEVSHVIKNKAMEVVLDSLRMIDDGQIKKDSSLSSGNLSSVKNGKLKSSLPVIRKPFLESMNFLDQEKFRDGEAIVREGGYGSWVWVVLSGVVEIKKKTPRGPITIAKLGEGCFIGSLASFTIKESSRSATATASGDVQLGVLDFQSLADEYGSLSSDFQVIMQSLDERLRNITSRAVYLVTNKDAPFVLSKDMNYFIKEGSSKEELFCIKKGKASLIRKTPHGHLLLNTFKKGNVFGHMPFLDVGQEPRCASVVASSDLQTNKLDIVSIQNEYYKVSGVFKSLIDTVVTCISMTNRMVYDLKMEQNKKKKK